MLLGLLVKMSERFAYWFPSGTFLVVRFRLFHNRVANAVLLSLGKTVFAIAMDTGTVSNAPTAPVMIFLSRKMSKRAAAELFA